MTFWLFMLHQGPNKRDWFESWEVRVWYTGQCMQIMITWFLCSLSTIGTLVSIIGLPLTVMITRKELMEVRVTCFFFCFSVLIHDQCEAWVFLVGSTASLTTTLCFIYVLVLFPIFIRHVKAEGADPDVVVRLSTFYNLNVSPIVMVTYDIGLCTLCR